MASLGYVLVDRILSGVSIRDAVFESLGYFRNSGEWENIDSENDLVMFGGTVAAFAPDLKMIGCTPQYCTYQFQVYCPDLIGSSYDADDPHPLKVTVYLPMSLDPNATGFEDCLKRSFNDGSDVRDYLKYLYAPGDAVFKSMKIERGW